MKPQTARYIEVARWLQQTFCPDSVGLEAAIATVDEHVMGLERLFDGFIKKIGGCWIQTKVVPSSK